MTYGSECGALKWKKWANATPQDDDIEMGKRYDESLEHVRNNHQERGTHKPVETFLENRFMTTELVTGLPTV